MNVALTGATGFIGSHILAELHAHGHQVTALIRDDAQADTVASRGATPALVDLYDRAAVVKLLLLDQGTAATRARSELGWEPSRPGLADEFRQGSYRS